MLDAPAGRRFSFVFDLIGGQIVAGLSSSVAVVFYSAAVNFSDIRMPEVRIEVTPPAESGQPAAAEPERRRRRTFSLPGFRFKKLFQPENLPDASARLELVHFFRNYEEDEEVFDDPPVAAEAEVDGGATGGKKVRLFRQRSNSFDSGADAIAQRRGLLEVPGAPRRRASVQDPLLRVLPEDDLVDHRMLPDELTELRRGSSLVSVIHPEVSGGLLEAPVADYLRQRRASADGWTMLSDTRPDAGSHPSVLRKIKRMLPFHWSR